MVDGVELCRVFEREAPDGSIYLVGMLGDAGIAIVMDQSRPGAWRVILSDPTRVNNRNDRSPAQALAQLPAGDDCCRNIVGEDFDELPEDLVASDND